MKPKTLRKIMIFWAYFNGLGAVLGSTQLFIDPTGAIMHIEYMLPLLSERLPWFACLFNDFVASGIVLLLVCFVPNLISAIFIHTRHRYDWLSCVACGVILMLWICLEFYVWGFVIASDLYFACGVLQTTTALLYRKKIQ